MDNYSIDFLLNIEEVNKIVSIFQNEKAEIRLVGGCVRNALLNKNYKDIDCAVNIHPNDTTKILQKNNIKFQDFAKKYGSVSAFINDKKIEITSLRKDIAQKGRHTDVLYTEDWKIDADRRDFTINALYLTSEGRLIDYFDGLRDLKENKIKFIGNIEKREKTET
jgi:tRNA nucleotidyltransferase/poly(A) polymerase